jgi:fucose permease
MTGVLRPLAEVAISAAFLCGVVLALLGSLKLKLSRSMDLGTGWPGGLLSLYNLALIPMMLGSGLLIDAYGVQPVLTVGAAACAISVFALGYRPGVPQGFAAVLLGGFGSAALCTGSLVLIPEAFLWHNPSASLNVGFVLIALGALITPPLVDVATRLVGYRRAMALMALACLVPEVLTALTSSDDFPAGATEALDFGALFSATPLWGAALVFLLYAPLEASISFWAKTFFTDHGGDEREANRFLSGFWGAVLVSRLLVAGLLLGNFFRADLDAWELVLAALLTAVAFGNLAGTVGSRQAGRGLVLVGLCLGPIAPTLLGMLFNRLSPTQYGGAVGILFAAGSCGSLILSPVIARMGRKKGTPQSALFLPLFGALLLTAASLVFALTR